MWTNNDFIVKWYEKDGTVFNLKTSDLLDSVGTLNEKLDPRRSSINTTTLDIEINNQNDLFSNFLYKKLSTKGKMFFKEIVEIYKNEEIIYKGFVRSISLKNSYETSYKIQLESVIGRLKTSLWDREFSEYLTETVGNINDNRLSVGFRMEERIKNPEDELEKQEKYRVITYSGHIFDCYKGILQMVLSKAEIRVNHLFLDNNYLNFIDEQNFNEMKKIFNLDIYNVYFEFLEPISNIFEFFQSQIFQAVGVVPIVTHNGKIKTIIHQQPTITEGIKTFYNDNIIKYKSKKIDESQVVNNLKINYVKEDDSYLKSILKISSSSFEFFGNELIPEKPQEISVASINKLARGSQIAFCSNIADRLFARYSREINILNIEVPIQEGWKIELGQFINIETSTLIDWSTGKRGFVEQQTVENGEKYVKFDIDKWGGFVEGNTLGVGADGTLIVTTTDPIIKLDIFRGNNILGIKSFLDNHREMKAWVDKEIG